MTPEEAQKIDAIHEAVFRMEPTVAAISRSMEGIDVRVRAAEIKAGQHDVQITRLQSDVDGLGRKVRYHAEQGALRPQAPAPMPPMTAPAPERASWPAFVALLAELPSYWHFIVMISGGLAAIVAALIKLHRILGG